jgi:hypothetical protein
MAHSIHVMGLVGKNLAELDHVFCWDSWCRSCHEDSFSHVLKICSTGLATG